MRKTHRSLAVLLATLLCHGVLAEDSRLSDIRLDDHPNPANSVSFTFNNGGPTVHLPKILIPESKRNAPVTAGSVELFFWYPDMTVSDWSSTMDKYDAKERGTYVSEKDRFRVHIIFLFYSNPDWDDLSQDRASQHGINPRPPRIVMNRFNYPGQGWPNEWRGIQSGLPSLLVWRRDSWLKSHPAPTAQNPEMKGTFVAEPSAPYELAMDCSVIECRAHAYSKSFHLQYEMLFASEAVAHTNELIGAIDKMFARWSEK